MDEILNLIESVSESFPSYLYTLNNNIDSTCTCIKNGIVDQFLYIFQVNVFLFFFNSLFIVIYTYKVLKIRMCIRMCNRDSFQNFS